MSALTKYDLSHEDINKIINIIGQVDGLRLKSEGFFQSSFCNMVRNTVNLQYNRSWEIYLNENKDIVLSGWIKSGQIKTQVLKEKKRKVNKFKANEDYKKQYRTNKVQKRHGMSEKAMWVGAPVLLLGRKDLNSVDKMLLLCLVDKTGDNKFCSPTLREISGFTGLSLCGIQSSIKKLEQSGYIKVDRQDNKAWANRYYLDGYRDIMKDLEDNLNKEIILESTDGDI